MDVKDYFQSYEDYFWEWTTDEDVPDVSGYNENNLISIPNVGPIVYRSYLIEVLKEFSQDFPHFGSMLLVLYALQDGHCIIEDAIFSLKKEKNRMFARNISDDIELTLKLLKSLNALPNYFKRKQNKILLLQTIFKNCHNRFSWETSDYILRKYERNPQKLSECAEKKQLTQSIVNYDFKTLAVICKKFPTTESIIEAMKGIVDIPELEDEVVQEETTVETDKDFIQELIEEPKTFQIGSLIKRIWSGLKIPMRHLSPGEQPIGGISDMTNKGDFNRMLLSEFANEDEVFMNRVANNEALYIQREIPPEENIFERIILIDTSLKNWGTPKVLAFASAIAVIKHPKAHSECKVFALGQTNIPISLDKVDEVIENLNQVSPVLEVSHALEKFFNEEHTEKDLEVFFITHQENVVNQNLQKVIHENRDRLKFLVTTSSDGELNFYKHHKGTRKHIQKIILPLKELWANPPQRRQKGDNNSSKNWKRTDVPINYPILFPTPVNKMATFLYEGEFYILSNKKQLLRTYLSDNYYNKSYYDYYKIHHGCEVLIEDISLKPKGQFALARNKQQEFILCQYQPDKKLISKLNLNTKEYSELNLTGKRVPNDFKLTYFNKSFYLYSASSVWIHEINIEGNISVEESKNDHDIAKNDSKVETEIKKLSNSGIKILNNFSNIGINAEKNLVISNNELNKLHDDSLTLYRNRHQIKIFANQNKNRFTFSDGSEVITDSRGMLTFKSSNKNIPEFYIPSTEYGFLALATHTEFGGSEYYLPQSTLLKMKKMEDMYAECLKRFIDQIWEYGA
ncbi:hypothetical protein J3D55_001258 [Chryseobacterium ginsenosidimutans]|uniref:hypothetical protein n=1 Tax=Chryseobacterium ginsenosidimutans TaxID=687846 RepID=UPI00216781FD|nr:hypothetical protein [Chryseobacterium ginsenosidimutans]MCS3868342.1 hypothetical protein [Chryseobacterium ginsenosidimutans]